MPAKCCSHDQRGPVQAPAPPPPHLCLHPLQAAKAPSQRHGLPSLQWALGAIHMLLQPHTPLVSEGPASWYIPYLHTFHDFLDPPNIPTSHIATKLALLNSLGHRLPATGFSKPPGVGCLIGPATQACRSIACCHSNPLVCIGPLNFTIMFGTHGQPIDDASKMPSYTRMFLRCPV